MNTQTRGPLDLVPLSTGNYALGNTAGEAIAKVLRLPADECARDAETEANARLLAAAFTAFDKAGRELGIDAATLAERIDLAAILRAAFNLTNGVYALDNRPIDPAHVDEVARAMFPLHSLFANLPKPTP